MNYDEYLRSARWRAKRAKALEYADHRCQLCSSEDSLEVHHNTYENLGDEPSGDLIVLCSECHERHHEHLARRPSANRAPDTASIRRVSRAWAISHKRAALPASVARADKWLMDFRNDLVRDDGVISLKRASLEARALQGDEQARKDLRAMSGGLEDAVRRVKGGAV